jgi:hypothetical protein
MAKASMPKNHLHADGILTGIGVIEQDIAAGLLDVAAKPWRAVDSAFLAHEADRAFAVDDQTVDLRDSWTKTALHRFSSQFSIIIMDSGRQIDSDQSETLTHTPRYAARTRSSA